jgi:hypothetical protein
MKNRRTGFPGRLSRTWRQHQLFRLAAGAVILALPIVVVASSPASAGVNLIVNPGAEQAGPGHFPLCWGKYGYGKNTYSIGTTRKAHSGRTPSR